MFSFSALILSTLTPVSLCVSAAYWRFWLCVTVVYELFLIFILFQVGLSLTPMQTLNIWAKLGPFKSTNAMW